MVHEVVDELRAADPNRMVEFDIAELPSPTRAFSARSG
jgi:hypothetical protein